MLTKITIMAPVWKRPKVTERFMRHWAFQCENPDLCLDVAVVGSEGNVSSNYPRKYGFEYAEYPNKPLGSKFNAGVRLALEGDPDFICIMGSDTFVLPGIWDEVKTLIDDGHKYIGVRDLYMHDWDTDQAVYWPGYIGKRSGEPIGPMRVIHKSLIPPNGELFSPYISRNLDASATKVLPPAKVFTSKPYKLVSVKVADSITPINKFKVYELEAVDPEILEGVY